MTVDLDESRATVSKRLDFIETEIKKIDSQIADKQGAQGILAEEIQNAQKQMQADAAAAAKAVIADA